MSTIKIKPDVIGSISGTLCLIHCLITPFIFVAHTCAASCCEQTPYWWRVIDLIFLIVSFFSVIQSSRTTSKKYMVYILWGTWAVFACFVLNAHFLWIEINENFKHASAIFMASVHLYNLKYCQCGDKNCQINEN